MVTKLIACFIISAGCALVAQGTNYQYDGLNRLIRIAYPDSTTIIYTYDSDGNRLSQVITNSAVSQPTVGIDKTSLSFTVAAGQSSQAQTVVVTNTGGGTLQWTAVPTASWLVATP